ncbi:MAG TPA: PaaI family thioesterase [Acetobacteraceae bacterium]|nr:PaaI family thioesterase [Acetobacteraceae bacterium]
MSSSQTLDKESWHPLRMGDVTEFIGPYLRRRTPKGYVYAFQTDERHANINGVLHGGMLVTFADQALGSTVYEATGKRKCVTASLNVQFVNAVKPGEFVECDAEVIRVTRSLVFIRGMLRVGDRVVLAADGVWKILGAP